MSGNVPSAFATRGVVAVWHRYHSTHRRCVGEYGRNR